MNTIILSPHCDDGPLSLGASLLARALGQQPFVHIVFSVSCYTKKGQCPPRVGDITALRQAEERQAAALAGYQPIFWNLPEPFVRRGTMPRDTAIEANPRADPVWPLVVSRMRSELNGVRIDLALVPVAPGGHIDHEIVREAAIDYLTSTGRLNSLGFYEDLPYASARSSNEIVTRVREASSTLQPKVLGSGLLQVKLALLDCYPSQLGIGDLNAVAAHASRLDGGERLWVSGGHTAWR